MRVDDLATLRPARHRWLVYTSAGDNSNIEQWTSGEPQFDVFATYYGKGEPNFRRHVNFLNCCAGWKFQNLHRAWQRWPDVLQRYDAVFVLDDDIRITTAEINRLFEYRESLDMSVLQPSFDPRCRISHPVTRHHPGSRYRVVSFVEVNAPLFRADALWSFLEVYDPRLVGWGVDWMYSEHLGLHETGRAAVIDDIACHNPFQRTRGVRREIDLTSTPDSRKQAWEDVKRERGMLGEALGMRTFERCRLRGVRRWTSALWWANATLQSLPRRLAHGCVKRFPALRRLVSLSRPPSPPPAHRSSDLIGNPERAEDAENAGTEPLR